MRRVAGGQEPGCYAMVKLIMKGDRTFPVFEDDLDPEQLEEMRRKAEERVAKLNEELAARHALNPTADEAMQQALASSVEKELGIPISKEQADAIKGHFVENFFSAFPLPVNIDDSIFKEYSAEDVRSVTFVMKMPAVIRLLRRITRKRCVKFSRMNVLVRDNFKCQYCGRRLPTRKLNYDHVVPKSQGGRTTWQNIVTSCIPCNDRKAGRTPEQAGMPLKVKPVKPRSLPVVAFTIDDRETIPEAWRNFLYWHGSLEQD